ncbi:MAG: bifunctional 4-hydroxy-2-oxoglutarate aldolase/2-dehydro-3-deoxy-phosphogluconate aldolase [Burkholderiaceae bacterium]|nr:bifunctional 4-hydroxy-2-oxoglutarate aldolase/2-dehydro-3-deoxy-phosphogluconate aldolase [Burkholderiaceae bacterium]MEB2319699.1 bifunctional 4-hydroxy-2-oxoglutarate aldolase/2-dehydro-3-deoxy-phosphogluconate aldolase [Pseudomonadota bacterium]
MTRPKATADPACPVIPVIVVDDAADAVPLARACVAGGLDMLEITLRTPAGLESIRRIVAEVPEARVGAGTVTRPEEFAEVRAAGARFAFSPGFAGDMLSAARDAGLEWIPGVATASEVMAAQRQGLVRLKFFPAAAAGGIAMLDALAGPFPGIRFCPTGGIDASNAADWLARPNVFAVGGSWPAPRGLVATRDWAGITALCHQAASLGPPGRS